jgi:hypothetical protein
VCVCVRAYILGLVRSSIFSFASPIFPFLLYVHPPPVFLTHPTTTRYGVIIS